MSFQVGGNIAGSVILHRPEIIVGHSHFSKEFLLRWYPGEHDYPGRVYEQPVPRSALSSVIWPGILHPKGLRQGGQVKGTRWKWQYPSRHPSSRLGIECFKDRVGLDRESYFSSQIKWES